MRCAVLSCNFDSEFNTENITLHSFPKNPSKRAVWLKVLNRIDWQPTESSMVCSKHFFKGDQYVTRSGKSRLREGALPVVNVESAALGDLCRTKVCRICFATHCNLYKMMEYKNLDQAYHILTGLSLQDEENLPTYLCTECTKRLLNCIQFRSKSLQAHLVLLEVIKKYDCITTESLKSIIGNENPLGSQLGVKHNGSDHYDLTIHHHVNTENTSNEGRENIGETVDAVKVEYIDENNIVNSDTISEVANQSCLQEGDIVINDFQNHNFKNVDPVLKGKDMANNTKGTNVKSSMVKKGAVIKKLKLIKDTANKSSTNKLEVCPDTGENFRSRFLLAQKIITRSITTRAKVTDVPKDQNRLEVPRDLSRTKIVKLRKPIDGDKANVRLLPYGAIVYRTVKDVPMWNYIKPMPRYNCNLCHYKAANRSELTSHVKTHGVKPFQRCECMTEARQAVLIEHSGETFSCDVCGQVFVDKDSLQSHVIMTSGGKPFKCDVCERKFRTKLDIEKHSRMHTGAKPYMCEICKKKFNYEASLKAHKMRVHSIKSI